jgi:hypothetical protein
VSSTRLLTGLASVALLVVGLVALLPDCASACTCAAFPGSQQEQTERALEKSSAVFSGEVVEISGGEPATVSFRVSEVWKGPEQGTLEVTTSRQESACGYSFKERKEYLVYTYGKEEPFKTDLCTETKPLSEATPDFEALGDGATVGDGGDTLSDTSGGFPRLDIVGMLGLAVATVSLVLLMRLLRIS